jgi:hypothetical protein
MPTTIAKLGQPPRWSDAEKRWLAPGPPRKSTERARTAIHESAHAVIGVDLRLPLRRVTIEPNHEAGSLGHVFFRGVSTRSQRQLERLIVALLAGEAAETIFAGPGRKSSDGSQPDFSHAAALASRLCSSNRELGAYLTLATIRAEQLVANPWTWAAIERLARELLCKQTVRGRDVIQIVEDARALPPLPESVLRAHLHIDRIDHQPRGSVANAETP